jgi:hypothetical protein
MTSFTALKRPAAVDDMRDAGGPVEKVEPKKPKG